MVFVSAKPGGGGGGPTPSSSVVDNSHDILPGFLNNTKLMMGYKIDKEGLKVLAYRMKQEVIKMRTGQNHVLIPLMVFLAPVFLMIIHFKL